MTTVFACPKCSLPMECDDKLADARVACPRCGRTMKASARTGPSNFVRGASALQNDFVRAIPDRLLSWSIFSVVGVIVLVYIGFFVASVQDYERPRAKRPPAWKAPPPPSMPLVPADSGGRFPAQ